MKNNLLIGNGLNIQLGGVEEYSNSAIMKRVTNNIRKGKYVELSDNALKPNEQLMLLEDIVKCIDGIKKGKFPKNYDGFFMMQEIERIKRTYPIKSYVESVFLEDYFLVVEIINNDFKKEDGVELNEFYRNTMFDYLRFMLVDGIYNDGKINTIYTNAEVGLKKYLEKFNNIFTTNYDYNIENII